MSKTLKFYYPCLNYLLFFLCECNCIWFLNKSQNILRAEFFFCCEHVRVKVFSLRAGFFVSFRSKVLWRLRHNLGYKVLTDCSNVFVSWFVVFQCLTVRNASIVWYLRTFTSWPFLVYLCSYQPFTTCNFLVVICLILHSISMCW